MFGHYSLVKGSIISKSENKNIPYTDNIVYIPAFGVLVICAFHVTSHLTNKINKSIVWIIVSFLPFIKLPIHAFCCGSVIISIFSSLSHEKQLQTTRKISIIIPVTDTTIRYSNPFTSCSSLIGITNLKDIKWKIEKYWNGLFLRRVVIVHSTHLWICGYVMKLSCLSTKLFILWLSIHFIL